MPGHLEELGGPALVPGRVAQGLQNEGPLGFLEPHTLRRLKALVGSL